MTVNIIMFTTPWFWQKKIFFVSFQHYNYHENKILLCYCYYVHYAMISTRNKTYFHSNTTFNTQLSWEKYCSIASHRKFSVSKRFEHDTVVSPSETSVESLSIFSLGKFIVFKRFPHDTVASSSGTSVESYMLYYSRV